MPTRAPARARVPARAPSAPAAAPVQAKLPSAPTTDVEDPGRGRERAARLGHSFDRVDPVGRPDVPVATPGSGRPIPAAVRQQMEASLGANFSGVRLHEGPEASQVGAIAYTRGENIHFAPGQLSDSPAGRRLLGHELTHIVQQRDGRVATPETEGAPINADAALEAEADALGAQAARGQPSTAAAATAGPVAATTSPSSAPAAVHAKAANAAPIQRTTSAPVREEEQAQAAPTHPVVDAPVDRAQPAPTQPVVDAPAEQTQATEPTPLASSAASNPVGRATEQSTAMEKGSSATSAVGGLTGGLGKLIGLGAENTGSGFGAAGSILGGGAQLAGGLSQAIKAVKESHTRAGLESGARMASGLGNLGLAGTTIANLATGGSAVYNAATASPLAKAIPGLSIATGGLDFLTGGAQAIRSTRARSALTGRMKELGDNADPKLMESLKFMHGVQSKVQRRGVLNAVAGGLQAAGGALTLTGVGGIAGTALAGIGTGLKVGRTVFGDLKQWFRDKAADNDNSLGSRFARFIGADASKSSKAKAQQMDDHVDRLFAQRDSKHIHDSLDDLGMSPKDLEDFKKHDQLSEDRKKELWSTVKGLHMKREMGDQASYGRGEWRSNLYRDTLPGLANKVKSGASAAWKGMKAAGSAIADAGSWAGGKIADGAGVAWRGMKAAGGAIANGASWLGGKVASGASTAASKIASGASWLGGKIKGLFAKKPQQLDMRDEDHEELARVREAAPSAAAA